jgi:glycosyltransferase involved in cell wall biosynthesis
MKILLVAEDFPWPSTGGGLIRLAKVIDAVSQLGETDLFTLYDPRRVPLELPRSVSVARLETAPYPGTPSQRRWRTAWMTRRGVPMEVVMRSFDRSPRFRFEAWRQDRYDLVWFSTAATFAWMGRPRLGPTIVDLMDLEDVKADQRSSILRAQQRDGGLGHRVRRIAAAAQAGKNARDWRTFQQSVAAGVERVVLCSDADVRRSGLPNAAMVPNTYERPTRSVGHADVGDPPVILLQGSLHYPPNTDAVDWLIDEIAPRLWESVPGAEIRLVGRPTTGVKRRHRPPAVTVVGSVPEMEPELARADIAVVPLRIGSGTRLKILESFAHRVPVVSTTLGADGLDVRDGTHLLLADDATTFAAACQRLLSEPDLRKRLVDAGEELFLQRYQWAAARDTLRQLVRDVAATGTTAPSESGPGRAAPGR